MARGKCSDRDNFIRLFGEVRSLRELGIRLGYKMKGRCIPGGVYHILKQKSHEYGLDYRSLKGQSWSNGLTRDNSDSVNKSAIGNEKSWDESFCQGSVLSNQSLLKKLIRAGKRKYKCERCGVSEWDGEILVLEIHHLNEIFNDNREENLQILCPNCHSHTKKGHESTILIYLKQRPSIKEYNTNDLRRSIPRPKISELEPNWRNRPRPELRKVARPSKEELVLLMSSLSICAIGRRYGVSDNAVRKWIKNYGIVRYVSEN